MAKVKTTAKATAKATARAPRGQQVAAKSARKAKKTTGAIGKVKASSSSTTTKTTYERVRVETTTTHRTSSIGSGGGTSQSRMSENVKAKIKDGVSKRVKEAMRDAKSAQLPSIQTTVYLSSAEVGFLPSSMRLGYESSPAARLLGTLPIRFGRTTQCKVSSLDMRYVKSSGSLVITIKTSPL